MGKEQELPSQMENWELINRVLTLKVPTLYELQEEEQSAQEYLELNEESIEKAITRPAIQSNIALAPSSEWVIRIIAEIYKRIEREKKEREGKMPQTISSVRDVVPYCLPLIEEAPDQEHVIVFDLHSDLRIIDYRRVFLGTQHSVNLSKTVLLKQSILNAAAQVVVVHNHPSGSLTPSQNDIRAKNSMAEAFEIVGIRLADMIIIVSDGRTRSIMTSIA